MQKRDQRQGVYRRGLGKFKKPIRKYSVDVDYDPSRSESYTPLRKRTKGLQDSNWGMGGKSVFISCRYEGGVWERHHNI